MCARLRQAAVEKPLSDELLAALGSEFTTSAAARAATSRRRACRRRRCAGQHRRAEIRRHRHHDRAAGDGTTRAATLVEAFETTYRQRYGF